MCPRCFISSLELGTFFYCVLIYVSLMTNDVESFFMCLLTTFIYSLKKSLFRSFAHFHLSYLLFSFTLFLYSRCDSFVRYTICRYFLWFLLIFPFDVQSVKVWWSPIYHFSFMFHAFDDSKKSLNNPNHKDIFLCFLT